MAKKVTYHLTITESNGHTLTPSYTTDTDSDPGQTWVEGFFGCNEPDVVDYSVERIVAD